MTKVYDRKTGEVSEVAQYGGAGLKFLYGNPFGRILLRFVIGHFCSNLYAAYNRTRLSRKKIQPFVNKHHMKVENPAQYHSFAEFFTRQEARTVSKAKTALIAPADSKLLCYPIDSRQVIKIKHTQYSIRDLVGRDFDGFEKGHCLVFRLAVDDYHHYCFVDDGELVEQNHIKGRLHTVSSFSDQYRVFAQNDRVVSLLKTKHFGDIIQVEVGAMLVGRINNRDVQSFKKGEEKGYFDLGGSTIVLLVKDDIKIDDDILAQSAQGIETKVSYGEKIGGIC